MTEDLLTKSILEYGTINTKYLNPGRSGDPRERLACPTKHDKKHSNNIRSRISVFLQIIDISHVLKNLNEIMSSLRHTQLINDHS